ncbi:MAG: hypothetical protein LBC10_00985, partial [Deltaproteobacteria bacterium]|nr:hypothetical protein [Deltaproteobacteria bacterium]
RLPLALGAATTLAAFAAFFSSSIPGIVQLTWFAIFGVAAAGILALIVLPHCLTPGTVDPDRTTSGARDTTQDAFSTAPGVRPKIRPLAALWTASVIVLGLLLYSLPISSDITALSYVSEANRTDERRTREIWGELRERALVAVIGDTMQHALEKNDRLWTALHAMPPENAFPAEDVFGLASILPAQSTQHARQRIWQEFWAEHGPAALARLNHLAHAERFAPEAFLPFKAWIESTPPLITPQFFIDAGFSLPLTLLRRTGDKHLIYSLVPTVPLNPELAKTMRVNDAVYVSGQSFRDALHSATRTDILHFGALALAGILAIIFWGLRSPARTGLALLPIAAGLACVLAVFHLAGMSLNIFHAMALPLVMALSVDYGVFMLAHLEGKLDKASRTGILLSGITSLSSFGVLMLADHPALFSLGFTVSFGLGGAVLAALCVLPFFVTTGTTPGHEDANHSFV